MTTIEVRLDRSNQPGRGVPARTFSVIGEPDEPFHIALVRAVNEPLFPRWSSYNGDIEVRIPERLDWAMIPIDRQATLAQVATFAGGETLPMSIVGRGGGVIPTLLDYLNAGLTIAGVADLLRRGHAALDARLWRHERAAARRWIVAGTDTAPRMDLIQYVRAEPYWDLDGIATHFEIDRQQAVILLRRLDYEPTTPEGIAWRERPED